MVFLKPEHMNMNFIENEFVDSRLLERENTVDDSDNRKKLGIVLNQCMTQ